MLTVDGRSEEIERIGPSNLAIIKKIKETLDIPVIAHGGISTFKDV